MESDLYSLLFEQGGEIRELRARLEAVQRENDLLRGGDCLGVIPKSFVMCSEGGYYCSSSCKLAASLKNATLREGHFFRAYQELKETLR